VEPRPAPEHRFVERLKELRTTNDKPPLPELYPADSLEALLQKIKTKVLSAVQQSSRVTGSLQSLSANIVKHLCSCCRYVCVFMCSLFRFSCLSTVNLIS